MGQYSRGVIERKKKRGGGKGEGVIYTSLVQWVWPVNRVYDNSLLYDYDFLFDETFLSHNLEIQLFVCGFLNQWGRMSGMKGGGGVWICTDRFLYTLVQSMSVLTAARLFDLKIFVYMIKNVFKKSCWKKIAKQ